MARYTSAIVKDATGQVIFDRRVMEACDPADYELQVEDLRTEAEMAAYVEGVGDPIVNEFDA